MKSADYLKQLRTKSPEQLVEELAAVRKEQFNLRLQHATGQESKTHLAGEAKRKIARLKTVLKQAKKTS